LRGGGKTLGRGVQEWGKCKRLGRWKQRQTKKTMNGYRKNKNKNETTHIQEYKTRGFNRLTQVTNGHLARVTQEHFQRQGTGVKAAKITNVMHFGTHYWIREVQKRQRSGEPLRKLRLNLKDNDLAPHFT
jgi:hypothetical protein